MEARHIRRGDPDFPHALKASGGFLAIEFIDVLGNISILQGKMLGLLCSVKCPGGIVLKTFDTARALRDAGVTVIGGFHSPMEKECLDLLLRGKQAVVVCPARSIQNMRLPAAWRKPIAEGRLLLLSPFDAKVRRVSRSSAGQRNALVVSMADGLLVLHAASGGDVEAICCQAAGIEKEIYTLNTSVNRFLSAQGAQMFDLSQWVGPIGRNANLSVCREGSVTDS